MEHSNGTYSLEWKSIVEPCGLEYRTLWDEYYSVPSSCASEDIYTYMKLWNYLRPLRYDATMFLKETFFICLATPTLRGQETLDRDWNKERLDHETVVFIGQSCVTIRFPDFATSTWFIAAMITVMYTQRESCVDTALWSASHQSTHSSWLHRIRWCRCRPLSHRSSRGLQEIVWYF